MTRRPSPADMGTQVGAARHASNSPRPLERNRASLAQRAIGVVAVLSASAMLLTACAPEADSGWTPPAWSEIAGVSLSAEPRGAQETVPGSSEEQESPADTTAPPSEKAEASEAESKQDRERDTAADSEAAAAEQSEVIAASGHPEIGLLGQRVRNDTLPLQARWVYLPQAHELNDRIDQIVWNSIVESGKTYEPQAAAEGSKLGERGCVAGSAVWPAAKVLKSELTGPQGGTGTAITCDLAGAFDKYAGVTMRVVKGNDKEIESDVRTTLYADLSSGAVIESGELWNDTAAPELWLRAIELLRRDLGGLSTAPIEAPDNAQLELAQRALDSAQRVAGGGLEITLPEGLASPELAGLGVAATAEPLAVAVDNYTAVGWASENDRVLAEASSKPFIGFHEWTANTRVDCALVPCVALTYDDGPTELTPQLLDTLREHQAPATFFMIGNSVNKYPEIAAQVAADGHETASHTMAHPDLTTLKPKKAKEQVLDAAALVTAQSGLPVTSYRPPYGAVDAEILKAVDLPAVLWSIDTNDWQKPGQKELIKRTVPVATPGDIVLFHDTHEDSVEVAGKIITGLRDRGFVPVTVTQLFDGKIPEGRVSQR